MGFGYMGAIGERVSGHSGAAAQLPQHTKSGCTDGLYLYPGKANGMSNICQLETVICGAVGARQRFH
eukprot:271643-Prymnesium_polylepis.1